MDQLSQAILLQALAPGRFGRPILYFPIVDSTNEAVRRLAGEGAGEGTAVVGDLQLQGRGRRGRRWLSRPGEGLCLSLLLRPELPPARAAGVTILAAVAAALAIEDRTGLRPGLKWPNDLLLEGRKVGGILAETGLDRDGERYLVLGIGINVHGTGFPPELEGRATSLRLAGGRETGRAELAAGILNELERLYRGFKPAGDILGALPYYRDRSVTVGRRVRASGPGGEISGRALGITEEGGLLLRGEDGREIILSSGEVTLREETREDENAQADR